MGSDDHQAVPRDLTVDRRAVAVLRAMTYEQRLEHGLAWNEFASQMREAVQVTPKKQDAGER